jgi:hypothetical protein
VGSRSSRDKHSFIQFYFDDWKAGTAHMGRVVRSVYFDICLYTWDKRKAVSPAALMIMLADVDNGLGIVDALVAEGALVTDAHGNIHSPRALREAERAFRAWESKSLGGKRARGVPDSEESSISAASEMQHPSEDSSTDSDSDSDSEEERQGRDSNLDLGRSLSLVASAWNDMARAHGLKQVAKMTSERTACLGARIEEHGVDALIAGIAMIPMFPFLMGQGPNGWKAHFDWFLRPDSFVHVVEGDYEPRRGKTVAEPVTGPMNAADASKANAALEQVGSKMRWRLESGQWLLRVGTGETGK